jgi:hypothetical protein
MELLTIEQKNKLNSLPQVRGHLDRQWKFYLRIAIHVKEIFPEYPQDIDRVDIVATMIKKMIAMYMVWIEKICRWMRCAIYLPVLSLGMKIVKNRRTTTMLRVGRRELVLVSLGTLAVSAIGLLSAELVRCPNQKAGDV